MRLIDVDAIPDIEFSVCDATSANGELDAYCRGMDKVMEVVKFMPTIEVQQWIPCSERLPKEKINPNTQDYDWVLCSTTFGDVRAYHFGRGRFLHGCGDVTQYVIAWMPLPEPYQGEGEQDE